MINYSELLAIIIPDVHGREFWKDIIEDYDGTVPVIFLGDYLDPYSFENITPLQALENFKEIWEFKEKWGDKVICNIGNHDLSYYDIYFQTCRYSREVSEWYGKFLRDHFDEFNIVTEIEYDGIKYLFSHAGIHPQWLHQNNLEINYSADYINSIFRDNPKIFYQFSYYRGGYDTGSPVWADIREYPIESETQNIIQIIGHTQLNDDGIFIKMGDVYCIDSRRPFILKKDGTIESIKENKEE